MDYMRCVQMNNFVEFDVDTITAGDYTVYFELAEKSYETFKNKFNDENNPMSENMQFKLYLKMELEDRLNKMKDFGYRELFDDGYSINIAQITVAYENGWIID